MPRTPAILLSAASLLCFVAISAGLYSAPVPAGAQEPDYRSQPTDAKKPQPDAMQKKPGRRMDSHTALGLGRVPDAAAAKRGEALYKLDCQACHGEGARGSIGPNLVRSVLVLHDEDDTEIMQVIRTGRMQAGMPPFTILKDGEMRDIAEYLHQLVELAANRGLYKNAGTMASGDEAKGKAFFAANCASCHSVTGDLAKIGTKFSDPAGMLSRIAWPAAKGPREATVTTADGRKLTGTLARYNDFETTLKASDGTTTTWKTDEIKVEIPEKIAVHRALLPKYTDDDLHNLTRYLMTIK